MKNSVETDFLKLLSGYLKTGRIKLPLAKEITKEFLAMLPFNDLPDLQSKLKSFTLLHPEFNEVYLTLLSKEETENTTALIGKMKLLIKENRIDEALSLVE